MRGSKTPCRVILPVLLTLASVAACAQSGESIGPPRTITVVGEGYVSAQPDMARTQIGIVVYSEKLKEATSEVRSRMQEIMKAIEKAGIAQTDMQTVNYSINFERDPSASKPQRRYRVDNTLVVKVRNLEAIGTVLDTAIEAGANNIWGVQFGIDDTEALESAARAAAVENARSRAAELSQLAGVSLGSILSISEVIGAQPYAAAGMAMAERSLGGGGPIAPGEMEVLVRLQVVFELR